MQLSDSLSLAGVCFVVIAALSGCASSNAPAPENDRAPTAEEIRRDGARVGRMVGGVGGAIGCRKADAVAHFICIVGAKMVGEAAGAAAVEDIARDAERRAALEEANLDTDAGREAYAARIEAASAIAATHLRDLTALARRHRANSAEHAPYRAAYRAAARDSAALGWLLAKADYDVSLWSARGADASRAQEALLQRRIADLEAALLALDAALAATPAEIQAEV